MLDALVITLREGIEAALVLGIIITYLQRTGRTSLNRYVYWGLGLAIVVSLGLGIVLQVIGFDTENEFLEGTLLGIGGLFVASMVVWMWRTARSIHRHMETRMETIVAGEKASRGVAAGLFAFTFFMVAREGAETVLFLAATTLGQEASILSLVGGILGIGLAVLFAILFIRGSLKLNLRRFFNVTTVVLLILAAKLLAGSVHEFAEVGVLPMTAGVMRVLGWFLRDRASSLIMTGLIILPVLLVLWDFRRTDTSAPSENASRAEQRKWRAAQRWGKMWQGSLVSATAIIVLAMASQAFAGNPFLDPSPQPVTSEGGEVRITTGEWMAEELHKFAYIAGDTEVRFIAAKLPDGGVITALDACQICGSKGFMQEAGNPIAICKVCNAPIAMSSMGLGGGCNPMVLSSRTEGTTIVISTESLGNQAGLFQASEAK
ncbi:MAG: DUF2318 domain-containing protein [Chloroflexi bacterium]|nr:DUF2318 domain-containing protein [Chloroflexota bacterium]